ncbi:MAG: SH3 domain-containing protein [Firmicutes bacterium]|nr:SH3 domain-containing protein [Bacillota bacterium]
MNLREGSGTDFAKILTVPQGAAVEIMDFLDNEWYLVNYENQTGYMKAEFLAATKQN